MRSILFILLLMLSYTTYAQQLNTWTDPTPEHINISGSEVFLIPPSDFVLSTNFKGFMHEDEKTSLIMLMEIPGPFKEVISGFNPEMMAPRGMTFIKKEQFTIDNKEGLIVRFDQEANGLVFEKSALVFGDEKASVILTGMCLKESNTIEAIEKSLISLVVSVENTLDPRLVLDYSIDESNSDFKFISVIGNGMLFNKDRLTPTQSKDQASVIIDRSYGTINITDKPAYCLNRLHQFPEAYELQQGTAIEEITIRGLEGYQLLAEKTDEPEKKLYQVMLFLKDGSYYLMVGRYRETEGMDSLMEIKELMGTFELRKAP